MSEPNKLSVESGSDESEYTFGRQPIQDWPQHQKNDTGQQAPPTLRLDQKPDWFDTKWTMVLVESKVHYWGFHKYQWNVDVGGLYFLLDERVSWFYVSQLCVSKCIFKCMKCWCWRLLFFIGWACFVISPNQTIKNHLLLRGPQFCIRKIVVTHTTLKFSIFNFLQGEVDVVVQGDNTIMRVDAAIRWIFSPF